jgi:MerR family mercuric resistance operon transcriptional regulator
VAPSRRRGEWRRYRIDHINRVRFIRGARTLGFSLKEIGVLLKLEDGTDRRSLRRIATTQLEGTRRRIADLRRIERALARLIQDCETRAKSPRCPITRMIL